MIKLKNIYMANWHWRTKLKTNEIFTKWLRKKIKYQKNKYHSWNFNNKKDKLVTIEREKKNDSSSTNQPTSNKKTYLITWDTCISLKEHKCLSCDDMWTTLINNFLKFKS